MPVTKARIKDTIAELEAELASLQARHAQATSGVEQARSRLAEIGHRRGEIASKAYFGDEEAVEELAALDVETSTLTRAVSLALDAAASLEGAITDARERLVSERHRVSRETLNELKEERQRVQVEALKAADELLEVLAKDERLHAKMIAAAQSGASVAGLENIARNHPGRS